MNEILSVLILGSGLVAITAFYFIAISKTRSWPRILSPISRFL